MERTLQVFEVSNLSRNEFQNIFLSWQIIVSRLKSKIGSCERIPQVGEAD